jgi:hypothetical protein
VFGKRERPHLFYQEGRPTHFITGVCIIPQCDPWGSAYDPEADCSSAVQYIDCDRNYYPGLCMRSTASDDYLCRLVRLDLR